MKYLLFVVLLVYLAIGAGAQVYTIDCKYTVQIISSKHFVQFDRIDTGNHYKFVVDLDKKTLFNASYVDGVHGTIPITEVERYDEGRLLILHVKREDGYKWNYYQMQLGANGEPKYIELVERMKGGGADTFFRVHTSDLGMLFFRDDCLFVKDTVFTSGSTTESQTRALKNVRFKLAKTSVEMRNGVISWRDGDNLEHRAVITQTIIQKHPGTEGIIARCQEGDVYYDVSYAKSDRTMDNDDHYSNIYVVFTKYVHDKMVSVTIRK